MSEGNTQEIYMQLGMNIQTTASQLLLFTSKVLKSYKLTFQQYNVLVILRGEHPEGVSIKAIGEKMIDRNSNASRLVDKLVIKGLAIKESTDDKRIVKVLITQAGLILMTDAIISFENKFIDRMKIIDLQEARLLNIILQKLKERKF